MILKIVDIFEGEKERERGLQFRGIDEDECALFLYDADATPGFWNINVPVDLYVTSIVDGKVCESLFMPAYSIEAKKFTKPTRLCVESAVPIDGAVEVMHEGYLVC